MPLGLWGPFCLTAGMPTAALNRWQSQAVCPGHSFHWELDDDDDVEDEEPLMTSSEVCKQYRRWAKAQRKSYRIMLSKQLYSCSEYIITVVENIPRGVEIFLNISAPRRKSNVLNMFWNLFSLSQNQSR